MPARGSTGFEAFADVSSASPRHKSHNIGGKGCVNSPPRPEGGQDAGTRNPYPQYYGIYVTCFPLSSKTVLSHLKYSPVAAADS